MREPDGPVCHGACLGQAPRQPTPAGYADVRRIGDDEVSIVAICSALILALCVALVPWDGLVAEGSGDCPTFGEMRTEKQLLLIDCLPFGSTMDDIRPFFPGATFDVYRFHGTRLRNVEIPVEIGGIPARLEFALNDGRLYGLWYHAKLSVERGDSLFARLTEFYSELYGEPIVSDEGDSPYFVMSRSWCTPSYEAGVSMSLAGDARLVGWGFQGPCRKREEQPDQIKLMREVLDGC